MRASLIWRELILVVAVIGVLLALQPSRQPRPATTASSRSLAQLASPAAPENPEALYVPAADAGESEDDGLRKAREISATVNGVPIFTEDVVRTLPDEIMRQMADNDRAVAVGAISVEQSQKYRRDAIGYFLQQHIDQELLLQALKRRMDEDDLANIRKELVKLFVTEDLAAAIEKAGVTTPAELEQHLRAKGSSIDALCKASCDRSLAQHYLWVEAESKIHHDRAGHLKESQFQCRAADVLKELNENARIVKFVDRQSGR